MNNIDWKAFETNMSLMLINMKLESLPTDLEKLVDKSYELADNVEKELKKEAEKAFADIEKMPEVIEETSELLFPVISISIPALRIIRFCFSFMDVDFNSTK